MPSIASFAAQQLRNESLIKASRYMRGRIRSSVVDAQLDIDSESLSAAQVALQEALQIESARTSISALASLATIGELDHLGGGLDLIPALTMTLALTDYERVQYTVEHAHTSIGYYAALAALGFLDRKRVVETFRRGLDIPGHVSWVPGGTELNGGRLGVMIPAAVGQAVGLRARKGPDSWVICHCGDAGWISGQALNGFNAADLHRSPVTFVMHRNGIQLSGTNKKIMDKDPRPIIRAMGIEIIETTSLSDVRALWTAYRKARALARQGRPSMIYPVGYHTTLQAFAQSHQITSELAHLASKHGVDVASTVWIPGSLMSYRDAHPMLECIFLVNQLPGGEGHHDGHMKGRKEAEVLAGAMFQMTAAQQNALDTARAAPPRAVETRARPAPGSKNLVLPRKVALSAELPAVGKTVSARVGVEVGYALVAREFPEATFVVSCDLDPSTKLGKARTFLKSDHQFELSIEEQAAAIMANGLAVSSRDPQLNVVSTFAAFFEGIAREGLEMWRYQRNLNGVNEGLNVTMHLSHVGSCTGRDHFSGWSLDWITLALGYLPYLHRFYAPADARSAFLAVKDLAAHYGGHIIAIPRDNLPILEKQGTSEALWKPSDAWEAVTAYRRFKGARKAILAFGATAFVAGQAADAMAAKGKPVDVYVVQGLPLDEKTMRDFLKRYPRGLVTVEDGLIAEPSVGLRGFAGLVQSAAAGSKVPLAHIGITDPRVAPADGHHELWAYFGITSEAIIESLRKLG